MPVEEEKVVSRSPGKFRQPKGPIGSFGRFCLGIMPVLGIVYVTHIPEYLGLGSYREQYLSLILSFVLASTFLLVPGSKKTSRITVPWYDVVLVLLSFISGGYVCIFYSEIVSTLGYIVPARVVLGGIIILLVFEASRRLVGWPVLALGVIFLLYAPHAYLLPSIFHARMIPWARVVSYLYLSPAGLLGIPLSVVGTIIFSFIFFGQVLFAIGGGQFLSDLALAMMGRYKGGPAKVAIVASCFFGTLSGSPSANVAMTGIVTIPLMKRIGFKPHYAGAVEAVASTGGLIMPPVMGAVAFIMAEFLEVPYAKVAFSALLPAILYYVAVFSQVHFQAVKLGLVGLSPAELPNLRKTMKRGWVYLLPVAVLLYSLFGLYMRAEVSALYSVAAMAFISLFTKEMRKGLFGRAWSILTDTGRALLDVAAICGMAGLIIGVISLTGLGLSFSDILVTLSGGNVRILLLLSAIGAAILGMGMPITATYIMLVILVAPALVQMGIEPMAAHFFIMYFANMSFLTPPVAIAAYVAAAIAGSEPVRTGFTSVRLGVVAFIVPFVFVSQPSLLLLGPVQDILLSFLLALIGTVFLSAALEGYFLRRLNLLERSLLGLSGLVLFFSHKAMWLAVGLAFIAVVILWSSRRRGLISSP